MNTLTGKNKGKSVLIQGLKKKDQISLEYPILRKAVLTLRSLNHPIRQRIVEMLKEKKKMTVTEIYIKLRLEQSVASQHLAILRRVEVLRTKRDGKFIFYTLNRSRLNEIRKFAKDLIA